MKHKKPDKPDENTDADDGADLFREFVKDITPISQDKIDPDSGEKKRKPKPQARKVAQRSSFGELEYATPVEPDEVLSFARDGLQPKLMNRLKKGQYPIEGKIDLHGKSIELAGESLQQSIHSAVAGGLRCILVVHGRGMGSHNRKPAIKTHVNQWLRESRDVLAFHSALPQHGGTGAAYVLLKRIRD